MNAKHTTRKTLEKRTNRNGVTFALVSDGTSFEVWKLCENYNRSAKGGIEKTWRYVEKHLSRDAAERLFNRRAA